MLKPSDAQTKILNGERMIKDLESYVDRILAIEMAGGRDEATVIFQGYEYTCATFVLNAVISKYSNWWDVEDVSKKQPFTYVLKFKPRVVA